MELRFYRIQIELQIQRRKHPYKIKEHLGLVIKICLARLLYHVNSKKKRVFSIIFNCFNCVVSIVYEEQKNQIPPAYTHKKTSRQNTVVLSACKNAKYRFILLFPLFRCCGACPTCRLIFSRFPRQPQSPRCFPCSKGF